MDQVFVNAKHWLVSHTAAEWQPIVSILLSIIPILMVFPALFALATVIERKVLGRIQNRFGPNRVGPFGFLQWAADGLKMLTKEDVVPRAADKVVHFVAPVILVVPALLAFAVLPYGRNMVPIDIDGGLLFFFAVGAATEVVIFMAGWSSRNKYSLLGAMRAIAQMISYEMPLVISALTVVMLSGSLRLPEIIDEQSQVVFGFLHTWHVFTPWGLAGFLLFLVAATAEANRTPFDLPEAESELVAGYFTEYSGFKFALFFLAEYLGLFGLSGLAITLFLGGWTAPFTFLDWIPSWLCFFLKLFVMIGFFIWLRGTLPRLRADQLMNFAWKFMLPMTLINLLVAALWHYSGLWGLPGGYLVRWLIGAAALIIPYVAFGRVFQPKYAARVYRFAE